MITKPLHLLVEDAVLDKIMLMLTVLDTELPIDVNWTASLSGRVDDSETYYCELIIINESLVFTTLKIKVKTIVEKSRDELISEILRAIEFKGADYWLAEYYSGMERVKERKLKDFLDGE